MKIAIIGYGKMGKAIEEIAIANGHEIVLKIDASTTSDFIKENVQKADVAIEFTGPHAAYENISNCIEWGVPVVSGSTGWLDQFEKVKKLCEEKKGCLIYASNFSIGVNLFFEINKQVAALMEPYGNYDISMTEIHHTEKKDAPSGTAISLAEQILAKIGRKTTLLLERVISITLSARLSIVDSLGFPRFIGVSGDVGRFIMLRMPRTKSSTKQNDLVCDPSP